MLQRRPARRVLAVLCALTLAGSATALSYDSARAASTELFISEYVEGSSNNKALEVYNGTGAPVTLTGSYDVQVFANGSPTATATIALVGTVADGDVFVLARSAAVAAVLAAADQTTGNALYNGNDAVVLRHDGTIVDAIGQIGVDPGVAWASGSASTADRTLRRSPGVSAGDEDGTDAFDPGAGWVALPIDTFDGLGAHVVADPGPVANRAPVAVSDSASLPEDAPPLAIRVVANDSDPDGDVLTVTAASGATRGAVAPSADGAAVVYTPAPDANGTDSFTYTLSDGRGGTASGRVDVTIAAVNDVPAARPDAAAVAEDGAVEIEVLANDLDPDGDALAIASVAPPGRGTATIAAAGRSIDYRPARDASGTDEFTYTVEDAQGGTAQAVVHVSIDGVNDPPVAHDDTVSVAAGARAVVDVLANDTDVDGDALTVAAVDEGALGTATVLAGGTAIAYEAGASGSGLERLRYTVVDAGGATATASIEISIETMPNAPPIAVDDTAAIEYGVATSIDVLANDRDPDGDPLQLAIAAGASHGVAAVAPEGDVIRYTPAEGFAGEDGFGYSVSDGRGGSSIGSVRLVVGPPPTAPAACAHPTVAGTAGADILVGSPGSDVIAGGGGDDLVVTFDGADVVCLGGGDDLVLTGPGDDVVLGGGGRDRVLLGAGDDRMVSPGGDTWILAGAGADVVHAEAGANVLYGGAGDDVLESGDGDDRLDGGRGDDRCAAGGGVNTVVRCNP